jgi:hypothetical protein
VRQKLSLVVEVVVNFVLPWLCYRFAKSPVGETGALLLATAPPILWSLVMLVRFRRLDIVSVLVIVGILLSLVTVALGGSPRVLLMRESLVTGFAGFALIASLLLPRPLMFYLAQATAAHHSPEEGDRFSLLWEKPVFVRCMYLLTWVWGIGLIMETIVRATLAWTIPTEEFLIVSPIIGYGVYFSLIGWTFWYARRLKAAAQRLEANA